jgi:hypothetical protein
LTSREKLAERTRDRLRERFSQPRRRGFDEARLAFLRVGPTVREETAALVYVDERTAYVSRAQRLIECASTKVERRWRRARQALQVFDRLQTVRPQQREELALPLQQAITSATGGAGHPSHLGEGRSILGVAAVAEYPRASCDEPSRDKRSALIRRSGSVLPFYDGPADRVRPYVEPKAKTFNHPSPPTCDVNDAALACLR